MSPQFWGSFCGALIGAMIVLPIIVLAAKKAEPRPELKDLNQREDLLVVAENVLNVGMLRRLVGDFKTARGRWPERVVLDVSTLDGFSSWGIFTQRGVRQ